MWPFRVKATPDEMPLRFAITLADPGEAAPACTVLAARLGRELSAQERGGVLQVDTEFQPGSAAILRPLNVLHRAGIAVAGLEVADLVTSLGDGALRKVVHDWTVGGNNGPYRRRVERLAGHSLLDRCLVAADAAERSGDRDAAAWHFAVSCVAFNTPGAEARLLDEAVRGDDRRADRLVDAARDRIQLARLAGLAIDVPPESLVSALRRRGHVAEHAARLASLLPAPLDDSVSAALRDLTRRGGETATAALWALGRAAPSSDVRDTCEAALASDDSNIRAAGLDLLARHWTDDARPVWREFLVSKSAPQRWTAERVIAQYGTEEDLPEAGAHLAKLIRLRQGIAMLPPRGSEIVDFLIRHREQPAARLALADLAARWPRLSDEMRRWLSEHHPWLAPEVASMDDAPDETLPEETLTWPPPSIEDHGTSFVLIFDEVGAHQPVRDRFEELAEQHPAVRVVTGDREWLRVLLRTPDPEGLVRELWSAASDVHSQP